MDEEKEKKKLSLSPRQIFWLRLVLFILFSVAVPFGFIAWRYGLFKNPTATSLNGWGISAVGIVLLVFIVSVRTLFKTQTYSFVVQCAKGLCYCIVPLLFIIFVLQNIKDNINAFIQVLMVVCACMCVAIPINPLPKYVFDNDMKNISIKMDLFKGDKK